MPRLIHLNGPSGVGKSTVAQLYADRHPGVLNLDIDRVVTMIGGWRDDLSRTLGPARNVAIAMAGAHLAAGCDVIMPQLVARHDQAARFASAARQAGAEYREIVLTADRARLLGRHTSRAHPFVDGAVAPEQVYDEFAVYARHRPDAIVLRTDDVAPDQICTALETALAGR